MESDDVQHFNFINLQQPLFLTGIKITHTQKKNFTSKKEKKVTIFRALH